SPQPGQGARRVLLRDGSHEGRGARLFRSASLAPGPAAAAEGLGAGDAAQLLGIWLGTHHPRLPNGGISEFELTAGLRRKDCAACGCNRPVTPVMASTPAGAGVTGLGVPSR